MYFPLIHMFVRTYKTLNPQNYVGSSKSLTKVPTTDVTLKGGYHAWIYLIKFFACIYSLRNDIYSCMICFFTKIRLIR